MNLVHFDDLLLLLDLCVEQFPVKAELIMVHLKIIWVLNATWLKF